MKPIVYPIAVCSLVTFLASTLFTFFIILVADKLNLVAKPTEDRWHKKTTPILGGVAMYLAFILGVGTYFILSEIPSSGIPALKPKHLHQLYTVIAGASGMFLLGLIDDFINIKAYSKLLWQTVIALAVAILGVRIEIVSFELIAIPLTVLWIIGISNALNLLDNMDGLAAGIVLIVSLSFAVLAFKAHSNILFPTLCLLLAASSAGFLIFNINPAKIFMGDTGSLFLGYLISVFALMGTWETASNAIAALIGPLLILSVPIFDTALVSLNRKLSGRKITQGGRDHSSHRLVALGLTERRAVSLILIGSAILSTLTVISFLTSAYFIVALAVVAVVLFVLFGMYLSELNVYDKEKRFELLESIQKRNNLIAALIAYKKQIFEVVVDSIFIFFAYFFAFFIRFDGKIESFYFNFFLESVPYVMLAKITAFAIIDPYKNKFRFVGIYEMIEVFKAVAIASFFGALTLFSVFGSTYLLSSIFIIDAMLSFFFLAGYRVLVRVIDEYFFSISKKAKNIIIVGASGFGEGFVRFLKVTRSKEYQPIGFLDEDINLRGRKIGGIRVLGSAKDLEAIIKNNKIDEVIFTSASISKDAFEALKVVCSQHNVQVKRFFSLVY